MRAVIITSIFKDLTRKTAFFERWSLFKFNNLVLALGTSLKFYTSVAKGLKLKVRKFWELIPTFVEVKGDKLVGVTFLSHLPPSTQSWIRLTIVTKRHLLVFILVWIIPRWKNPKHFQWEFKFFKCKISKGKRIHLTSWSCG